MSIKNKYFKHCVSHNPLGEVRHYICFGHLTKRVVTIHKKDNGEDITIRKEDYVGLRDPKLFWKESTEEEFDENHEYAIKELTK